MKTLTDRFIFSKTPEAWELERLVDQQKNLSLSRATYLDQLTYALFEHNFSLSSTRTPKYRYSIELKKALSAPGMEQLPPKSSPVASIPSNLAERNEFIVAVKDRIANISVTPDGECEQIVTDTPQHTASHLCPVTRDKIYVAEREGHTGFFDRQAESVTYSEMIKNIISVKPLYTSSLAILQKTGLFQENARVARKDIRNPRVEHLFNCPKALSIEAISPFSVATGEYDCVSLWDLRNTTAPFKKTRSDPVSELILKGNSLVCSTDSSQLVTYAIPSMEMTCTKELSERIGGLYPGKDNTFFSTSLSTPSIQVWEIENGSLNKKYQSETRNPIAFATVSEDGSFFLGASQAQEAISLWKYSKIDCRPRARQSLPSPRPNRFHPYSIRYR